MTLHMGSFHQTLHIFAAAQKNKDLQSPCPSSLLTNIFCIDPFNIVLETSGFEGTKFLQIKKFVCREEGPLQRDRKSLFS